MYIYIYNNNEIQKHYILSCKYLIADRTEIADDIYELHILTIARLHTKQHQNNNFKSKIHVENECWVVCYIIFLHVPWFSSDDPVNKALCLGSKWDRRVKLAVMFGKWNIPKLTYICININQCQFKSTMYSRLWIILQANREQIFSIFCCW